MLVTGVLLLIALCAAVLVAVWLREGVELRIRRAQHHGRYHDLHEML